MIFPFSILEFNLPGHLSLFFSFLYYMHTIFSYFFLFARINIILVKFIVFVVDLGPQKVYNWNSMET